MEVQLFFVDRDRDQKDATPRRRHPTDGDTVVSMVCFDTKKASNGRRYIGKEQNEIIPTTMTAIQEQRQLANKYKVNILSLLYELIEKGTRNTRIDQWI